MSGLVTKIIRRQSVNTAHASPYSTYPYYPNYNFEPQSEPQFKPDYIDYKLEPERHPRRQMEPRWHPPSSLDQAGKEPACPALPFDFRFSYTESNPKLRPIGFREPPYSPFGPGRLDRVWTGFCAPAADQGAQVTEELLEENRKKMSQAIQGEPLNNAERRELAKRCKKDRTMSQVNLGRDGLTHNILVEIQNHWKRSEVARIKCIGVPTVDMKNVCYQLEDKTFGKIIFRHSSLLVLYRGRNYHPGKIPELPLMLWKPHDPVYPKLIKKTIDGLNFQETIEMREKGVAVPVLTKLVKNGYYGNLLRMVQDAFLSDELVRIDCEGLPKSDLKKIGLKLRDLVPCILVTFAYEQIVIWRGEDYKPREGVYFLTDRDTFDDTPDIYISSSSDEEEFEETRS